MLDPQTQEIPLSAALDTADDAQGSPQGLPVVENIVWDKDRVMSKRHGLRRITGTSNPFADTLGLAVARTNLGLVRQARVNTYVGPATSSVITSTFANPAVNIDHETYGTYYGGTTVYASDHALCTAFSRTWLCIVTTRSDEASGTASPEVHVQGIDYARGGVVFDQSLGTNTFGARVVTMNNGTADFFGIFYFLRTATSTSTLKFVALTPVSQLTLGTAVTVEATTNVAIGGFVYSDVITVPSNHARATIAYVDSGGNYRLRTVDSTGANVATVLSTLLQTGSQGTALIALASGSYVLWTGDRVVIFSSALSQTSSTAYSTANQTPLGLIEYTANNVYLLQGDALQNLLVSTFDCVGLAATLLETHQNAWLSSKPWLHTVGTVTSTYVLATPSNAATTTYLTSIILRITPSAAEKTAVVGMVSFDEASRNGLFQTLINMLPQVIALDADNFLVSTLADLETPDSTTAVNNRRVRESKLHMGLGRPVSVATLESTAYIGASMLLAFDGTGSHLATFVDAPPAPTPGSATAGALTGLYSWRVLYEYTDVHGNIQVSPPGPVMTATLTANRQAISGTVAANILPDGQSGQRNFRVKIYRTASGGSIYKLAYTYAVAPGGAWSVTDNTADSTLKENLYTTGNVLESEPGPPVTHLATHRNRLFGIRSDTPEIIAYTQETFDPFFPRWHSALTFRVDNSDGPPTAVASLSDKLVVFQANAIVVVVGQGPDSTGLNGLFSQPETIARGVGVTAADKQSVCTVPQGVMFRHSTGIQLLGPDLQVQPIGRAIEDYISGYTTVRGRYLPSLHQTWFLLSGAGTQRIAVFDNRYARWSLFTTGASQFVDVIEHQGVVYLATADYLYQYDTTSYLDDYSGADTAYTMAWETPWFRVDRAQALRLWKLHMSSTAVSLANTTITAQVYTQQSEVLDKNAATADATYTWSSLSTVPAGPLTLTGRMVTQRCQAFRCRFVVTSTTANTTAVLRPATVTYDFGVLPSRGKVPTGRRPAAS